MGVVFGRIKVEEPAFEVLMKHSEGFSYEIRKYGQRFVVETENVGDSGFGKLAKFIGVFGKPENQGGQSIAMTAPVVKEQKPTAIAMTAPVVKAEKQGQNVMQFVLPAEYDSLSKIPKPTNPDVHIREIEPAVGAVHRFSGSYSEDLSKQKVKQLALQLEKDGVEGMTEEFAMQNYLWFGYHPPFTLPPFRRVEVWIPLTPDQVEHLVKGYTTSQAN